MGGGASFSGVALINRLQERQEVVVAGLLFFLGRVGLAEFRLERLPVGPKQTTQVRCINSAMASNCEKNDKKINRGAACFGFLNKSMVQTTVTAT